MVRRCEICEQDISALNEEMVYVCQECGAEVCWECIAIGEWVCVNCYEEEEC